MFARAGSNPAGVVSFFGSFLSIVFFSLNLTGHYFLARLSKITVTDLFLLDTFGVILTGDLTTLDIGDSFMRRLSLAFFRIKKRHWSRG